ncbi:hypothetical protein HY416_00850 [Candidatus Kaiserbacteria bacterium]|nr:hypothetical protein [Candidatus Kaiserbacteria bacterium]
MELSTIVPFIAGVFAQSILLLGKRLTYKDWWGMPRWEVRARTTAT